MADGLSVKDLPAIGWPEIEGGESALLGRCVVGDELAFAELVEAHQRMVYQLAFHLLGDHNEALDLSQDVFLRVFRTLDGFRGQSSFRTWIYRIVVNQARNRQRWWRRRHRAAQVSIDDHQRNNGEIASPVYNSAPDRLFRQKEVASRLWRALDDLPFDQKTAIILREVDGLSYDEIAYSLGIAVGTVKSRLARAREVLRSQLRDV
jgi:RNA polymerase sigma-70 factor (ECF subfamily)